jgi:hypothetical protein
MDNEILGPEARRLYWTKFNDLAEDIAKLLTFLEGRHPETRRRLPRPGRTVYVAETSSDVKERRDSIKRELLGHGYTVLPDEPLPLEGAECAAFVREQLSQCRLSVHVVGQNYGVVPDNATDSIVVLQHELASRARRGGRFRPSDLDATGSDLAAMLEHSEVHRAARKPTRRLQAAPTSVKTPSRTSRASCTSASRQRAPPKPDRQKASRRAGTRMRSIYLICDSRDIDDVPAGSGCPVRRVRGAAAGVSTAMKRTVRREHEANLANATRR